MMYGVWGVRVCVSLCVCVRVCVFVPSACTCMACVHTYIRGS